MALRRRGSGDHELDISAFADIAFLLIIFFILTTTFIKPAGSKMEIPSGEQNPDKSEKKNLTINLSQTEIRYGEKAEMVTLDELRARLLEQDFPSKKEDDRVVILDCGPDVPYNLYFDVVVSITDAGGVLALLDQEGGGKK